MIYFPPFPPLRFLVASTNAVCRFSPLFISTTTNDHQSALASDIAELERRVARLVATTPPNGADYANTLDHVVRCACFCCSLFIF